MITSDLQSKFNTNTVLHFFTPCTDFRCRLLSRCSNQTCHPIVGTVCTGISGGVLQTVLQGEDGGIAEIRERGVGDFIFGELTVIFLLLNFSNILSS